MLDAEILHTVRKLERDYQRGVLPWMVQARLDFYRAEATLREDMRRLAASGLLVRVGGAEARQGYRAALRRGDCPHPGKMWEKTRRLLEQSRGVFGSRRDNGARGSVK